MIGHAVSNVVPVVAANRTGTESRQTFYGHSFICDHRGNKVAELGREETDVITASFNFETIGRNRAAFGFFRGRQTFTSAHRSTNPNLTPFDRTK